MKDTCLKKYRQELSEQQYKYLYQRIHRHHQGSNESIQYSTTTIQSTITVSIEDVQIQDQLYQEFTKAFEEAQIKLYHSCLKTTQQQRFKANSIYEKQMKKIVSLHQNTTHPLSLPLALMNLIQERCLWIGKQIEYMYQYKMACSDLNPDIQYEDIDLME
jgi:hypothetical protein